MKTVKQSFMERADHACLMEAYVGASLSREGLYVLHTPLFEASKKNDRDILMNELSDLYVYSFNRQCAGEGPCTMIEVKSSAKGIHVVDEPHGVLLCSAKSFYRKTQVLSLNQTQVPCIYAFVDAAANIRFIPKGLPIDVIPWEDRSRGEKYDVVVALCQRSDFMTVKEVADGIKKDLGT